MLNVSLAEIISIEREQTRQVRSIEPHDYLPTRGRGAPEAATSVARHRRRRAAMVVTVRNQSCHSGNRRFREGDNDLVCVHVGPHRLVGFL